MSAPSSTAAPSGSPMAGRFGSPGLARPAGQSSAPALSALVGDRDIALRGQDDGPDRYGRQSSSCFSTAPRRRCRRRCSRHGEAVYSGLLADNGCAAGLLQAEAAARSSRRGVWAAPDAIKNAERAGDILAWRGNLSWSKARLCRFGRPGQHFMSISAGDGQKALP